MANPSIGELFKDRRVVIGSSIVGLGLVGGLIFFLVGQNSGSGGGDQAATPAVPAAAPAAPGGAPASPANPAAPGAAPNIAQAGKPGAVPKARSSFDFAPKDYPFGQSTTPGAPPAPGGGGGAGGAVDTTTPKLALAPIKPNVKAAGFRPDPFESYRFLRPEKPSAFNFIAPIRLASRSQPKVKTLTGDPPTDFGPLPFVPRRVAGVLYNGQVSAILETGTPGQDANVTIIQPGAAVTSGVPGIPDLTVAAISPTQVTLRAEDGRTVSVPLTAVPAAYESAFRASVGAAPGGDPNAGGPPPGVPGGGARGGAINNAPTGLQ